MASSFERTSKRSSPAAYAVAVAVAAFAVTPAAAVAGRFHVYSCRTPAGQGAPVDGWSGSKSGTYSTAENTCSQGGALVAGLGSQREHTPYADIATWALSIPASEMVAGATLWRAGDADGGAATSVAYEFWFAGPENNFQKPVDNFGQCEGGIFCPTGVGTTAQPLADANRLVVPNQNLGSHLYMNASCVGSPEFMCPARGDPNGYAAVVYLYAADLTIEQNAGPSASAIGGELAAAPTVAGTSDVAFSASDPGAGVYEAVFNVDGQVVQRTVVDENGGHCRDVGQTSDGTPAFLFLQPCLGSVSADVGLDTTKIANGPHHLIVDVVDAAGNAAPLLDRQIAIANAVSSAGPTGVLGPANGLNASSAATLAVSWRHTSRVSLTGRYGRAQSLVGRLTAPGGAPISGAQVELRAMPASPGARPIVLAPVTTAADGSFAVRLPAGLPSCAVQITYRAHIGDALPAASRTLRLSVHAGIALTIAPRTAGVGQSIFFRGRLLGRPVPHDGKQLVLEARSPGGHWIEFEVVRTDARGRYRAAYRFRFAGPARYQFRVLSEPESDYPFAAGSSRVIVVRER